MIRIIYLEMVVIIVNKKMDLYVIIQINYYFNLVKDVQIIIVYNV